MPCRDIATAKGFGIFRPQVEFVTTIRQMRMQRRTSCALRPYCRLYDHLREFLGLWGHTGRVLAINIIWAQPKWYNIADLSAPLVFLGVDDVQRSTTRHAFACVGLRASGHVADTFIDICQRLSHHLSGRYQNRTVKASPEKIGSSSSHYATRIEKHENLLAQACNTSTALRSSQSLHSS